jgi:hypothetical protein
MKTRSTQNVGKMLAKWWQNGGKMVAEFGAVGGAQGLAGGA